MNNAGFALYYLFRSLVVTAATFTFACVFLAVRWIAPKAGPRVLRRYLQWCGGGFIKLGQVLAMRFDMLPPAYCGELLHLLDRVAPISTRRIRAIVAAELGPRFADIAELEPEPLGAASIAQVHGARLVDGTDVVVKVMRPDVSYRLRIDLANLRLLARVAELVGGFGGRDLTGIIAEVVRLSDEELDFRREAFQADLMHRQLAGDQLDHRAPRVFFAYSTRRVLMLERFRGICVRDLIALVDRDDQVELARLAARGITPRRTARLLFSSILTQCLVHRVFHADPHAGNIVLLDHGTIGYIDFGMLGRLDERSAALLRRGIEGIATERYDDAYEAMLATIEPLAIRDLGQFQAQAQELFAEWRMIAAHPAATIAEKSYGLFFLRVADLIRRARLQMPARMMRYYRAQIVCDMVIYGLDPGLDPTDEFKEFFGALQLREAVTAISPRVVINHWRTLVIEGPRAAEALVRWAELRLPRLGAEYRNELTGIERAVAVVIRTLQRGLWLTGAVVTGVALAGDPAAVEPAGLPWWGTVAAAIAAALALRRAQNAMTDLT
jgi:ubiquinone biosynthesis protein